MKNIKYLPFQAIDLESNFFDSLKADYPKFPKWFADKANAGAMAYVFFRVAEEIDGFLYWKIEEGTVDDVAPPLPKGKHLKVGTLKINAHGTKLGERFMKRIFDHAVFEGVDDIYLTVFEKHEGLVTLISRYGFTKRGTKVGPNGHESVYVRDMKNIQDDVLADYPLISPAAGTPYLLGIYPEYHTRFLPDSKLRNEPFDILKDVSHTNSIHKIYISGVSASGSLKRGDILIMYRTCDGKGKAFYRSVATSVCVVEEIRKIKSFPTKKEFVQYVKPYSVFDSPTLESYFTNKKNYTIIKFTYNAALTRRIIRGDLLQKVGLSAKKRWDFLKLTHKQLEHIFELGELNANFIVN